MHEMNKYPWAYIMKNDWVTVLVVEINICGVQESTRMFCFPQMYSIEGQFILR